MCEIGILMTFVVSYLLRGIFNSFYDPSFTWPRFDRWTTSLLVLTLSYIWAFHCAIYERTIRCLRQHRRWRPRQQIGLKRLQCEGDGGVLSCVPSDCVCMWCACVMPMGVGLINISCRLLPPLHCIVENSETAKTTESCPCYSLACQSGWKACWPRAPGIVAVETSNELSGLMTYFAIATMFFNKLSEIYVCVCVQLQCIINANLYNDWKRCMCS